MMRILAIATFSALLLFDVTFGWVNDYDKSLKFECPRGQFMNGWSSEYSDFYKDRRFDFKCKDGVVGPECKWSGDANSYDKVLDYSCPENHVLTGAKSDHDDSFEDRKWQFKCCKIITAAGTQCAMGNYINDWRKKMDSTIPLHMAITGVHSVHLDKQEDRRYWFKLCKFVQCVAHKITITDDIQTVAGEEKIVGITAFQGCQVGHKYSLNLRHTDAVTEGNTVTVGKASGYSYSNSISLAAKTSATFLGTGVDITASTSASKGSSTTFSNSKSRATSSTTGSWSVGTVAFDGPGAVMIFAKVTPFTVNRQNVNADIDVRCENGKTYTTKGKISLKSSTFSSTHFKTRSAKFSNPGDCGRKTEDCVYDVTSKKGNSPNTVLDKFKKCFPSSATIAKK